MQISAWNPINFLDGEGPWVAWELFVLAGAVVASKLLGIVLRCIDQKIRNPFFTIAATSIHVPLISYLWFLVGVYSFDLVTDQLLSEAHPRVFSSVLNVGLVGAFGWFLLRLKNSLLNYAIEHRKTREEGLDATSLHVVSKLFTIVIGIIIFFLLNDMTGMNLTTLLAVGGVGGLAIAFASQEIVSNFFGGLTVHITRPFLLGETIFVPAYNIEGIVEEIGWYQTRIRSISKAAVYIPNSLFTKAYLVNKSRITHRLFEESIYIRVDLHSLPKVLVAINDYLAQHPRFDHREWAGSRVIAIGPVIEIALNGLTDAETLVDFYQLKDEVLIKIGELVESRGALLTLKPGFLPPA